MASILTEINNTDLTLGNTQKSVKETIDLSDKIPNRVENLERKFTIIEELLKALNERVRSVDADNISSSSNVKGFYDYVKQLTSISTFHGLPNVTTNKQVWLRLFWLLLMIAGFGLAVWQSVRICTEYFQFPVSTQFEIHSSGNVTFPQVTICNKNSYMKSKAMEHPLLQHHRIFSSNGAYGLEDFSSIINRDLTEEEKISLSHNLSDLIGFPEGVNLQTALVPIVWSGNCYTLWTEQEWRATDAGWGYEIYINIQAEEYIAKSIAFGALACIRQTGLFPLNFEKSCIFIKPGEHLKVGLSLETINRLSGKYDKCQSDEEKFRQETGINYSQDICRRICLVKNVLSKCGCYPYEYREFPSTLKIWNIFENVPECIGEGYDCFRSVDGYEGCECKPRCHMKKYDISVKRSKSSNPLYVCGLWPDLCKNAPDWASVVRSNVASISLSFDNAEHKVFTQIPSYSLYRFLSDIGGTLGLYVGASVLTLFELPQLVIVSVIYLVRFIRRD